MDALVGVTTLREVYVTNQGVPLTTATLTYTLVGPTGTTLVNAAATTNGSDGWYTYSVDGSTYLLTPGTYQETWTGSAGSLDLSFINHFRVGYLTGPLVTRLQLRHRVARRCDDLVLGTATAGAATTITVPQLVGYDDEFRGRYLYIYGGTGAGQERRSTDYVASTGVITVPTWTTTPDSTSRIEIHKLTTVEGYNDAINSAITETAHAALIPATDEGITVSDDTVYEYAIPAGFVTLTRVWWRDTNDALMDWQELYMHAPGRSGGLPDWSVVPGRNRLRLRAPYETSRLRIEGQMLPSELLRDGAYCDVQPVAYVEWQAAANILMQEIRGPEVDRDASSQRMAIAQQRAERLRPKRRMAADSVRV